MSSVYKNSSPRLVNNQDEDHKKTLTIYYADEFLQQAITLLIISIMCHKKFISGAVTFIISFIDSFMLWIDW